MLNKVSKNKKRLIVFSAAASVIVASTLFIREAARIWQKYHDPADADQKMTLSEAAKIGSPVIKKLMIVINPPQCPTGKDNECYYRGDIVLAMPEDHEFSAAEKSGFLIIKMTLTEKQAELLMLSLKKPADQKDKTGISSADILKQRKFSIDMAKIGIFSEDKSGREITDKIFRWEDVILKKAD